MAESIPTQPLRPADVAKFTGLVALAAIFLDAAVGHGLTWENDPYWTYWITKTFLIATIFGLGTAWFGMGVGVGAAITVVHTLVLTVYYWSLSPIGLPSSPTWLDLEHTWITGVPIHFGVIYLGYLLALWMFRRGQARDEANDARADGLRALVAGLGLVVVAGGLASLALGEFPGLTWFLVRLLITVPFLLAWWGLVGRDSLSAVVAGVTLALVWATYSQFLGPVGLPDTPLRILDPAPPPATVHWVSYRDLWLVSLPIYLVVMAGGLFLLARGRPASGAVRGLVATAVLAAVLAASAMAISPKDFRAEATLSASGEARVETGEWYSDEFTSGIGEIEVDAADTGDRVSPLEPHDRLTISASVEADGHRYELTVDTPLVSDPLGEHTTWWGTGFHVAHHGKSGIGSSHLPSVDSELAAFGLGTISVDGGPDVQVPVHVMTSEGVFPGGGDLELDAGDHRLPLLEGLPEGHLRVIWDAYDGEFEDSHTLRYLIGGLILLGLLAAALALNRSVLR